MCVPPDRETVVGGARGGEARFNALLKEINGLQMAQSIYSNETPSVAVSAGRCGGGAGSAQVTTRPRGKDLDVMSAPITAPGQTLSPSLRIIAHY